MQPNLWTFAHSCFQQCKLAVNLSQLTHHNNTHTHTKESKEHHDEDYPTLWSEQEVELDLSIYYPEGLKEEDHTGFQSSWKAALPFLNLQCTIKFENQETLLNCNLSKSHLHLDGMIGGLLIRSVFLLQINSKFSTSLLNLELNVELALPQDLPFNHKLVTDSHERQIRLLLDVNRHSPPKMPSRSLNKKFRLIYPLQVTIHANEVTKNSSIISLIMKNIDVNHSLRINDICHQLSLVKYDLERIFEMTPTSAEDSFEMISFMEDATTTSASNLATSSTLTNRSALQNLFKVENICHEDNFELQPLTSKCLVYRIFVEDEVVRTWLKRSDACPFVHFRYPVTIFWQPDSTSMLKTSSRPTYFSSAIQFSISTNFTSNINPPFIVDLAKQCSPVTFPNKNITSQLSNNSNLLEMLNIDCTLPSCVVLGEEFEIKISLYNHSPLTLSSCKVRTDNYCADDNRYEITLYVGFNCLIPSNSSHVYKISSQLYQSSILFKESVIELGNIYGEEVVTVIIQALALCAGPILLDGLVLSATVDSIQSNNQSSAIAKVGKPVHTRRFYQLLNPLYTIAK